MVEQSWNKEMIGRKQIMPFDHCRVVRSYVGGVPPMLERVKMSNAQERKKRERQELASKGYSFGIFEGKSQGRFTFLN